jgi:hypothetical protein
MNHIPAERIQELAAGSTKPGAETRSNLLPEEFAHMRECPQCIDLLAEAVREHIGREGRPPAKS